MLNNVFKDQIFFLQGNFVKYIYMYSCPNTMSFESQKGVITIQDVPLRTRRVLFIAVQKVWW